MSSKFAKKKTNQPAMLSRSDADFFRMSSLFFILCAVVLFIFKVMGSTAMRIGTGENLPYEMYKFFRNPIYIAVLAFFTVASAVWLVYNKVKKKDESRKILNSTCIFAVMLYIVAFSLYYGIVGRTNPNDSVFAAVFTVVLAIIYYVSKIYHRDFLAFTVENALLALLLFRYGAVDGVYGIVGKTLLIVAFAVAGLACVHLFKNTKSALTKGKQLKYLNVPYFVSLAIWAVSVFLCGTGILTSGVLLTVFLVQYIIFAIIYTIRLIRE